MIDLRWLLGLALGFILANAIVISFFYWIGPVGIAIGIVPATFAVIGCKVVFDD